MGYNMFAYCNNNPIIESDPAGYAAGGLRNNIVVMEDGDTGQYIPRLEEGSIKPDINERYGDDSFNSSLNPAHAISAFGKIYSAGSFALGVYSTAGIIVVPKSVTIALLVIEGIYLLFEFASN